MALDRAGTAVVDQLLAEPLKIPLVVVALDLLAEDSPKVAFTERNHLADTFRFRRSNELEMSRFSWHRATKVGG